MRIFTCTPVAFEGDARFFTRDSGLFCRALQSIGHESLAVMPGAPTPTDQVDVLRVDYERLESPVFWRDLNLDGLVLYSWAAPKYLPIARALRTAGVPFLVNIDFCGLISKATNSRLWWKDLLPYQLRRIRSPVDLISFGVQFLRGLGFGSSTRKRLETYDAATSVCAVSPMAAQWLKNEASCMGRPDLGPKICYLPHPQMDIFSYGGQIKENIVMSVGRWQREDWAQKNPAALIRSIDIFLQNCPNWKACIVGAGATNLVSLLGVSSLRNLHRIQFIDFVPVEKLVPLYNKASICCWASRSEGQIGAGAQALCCGCSVVSGNSGTLSCFYHYVSRESGRLAACMDASSLAEALTLEAEAWAGGQRDPGRIARLWGDELHERRVASKGISLLGLA